MSQAARTLAAWNTPNEGTIVARCGTRSFDLKAFLPSPHSLTIEWPNDPDLCPDCASP